MGNQEAGKTGNCTYNYSGRYEETAVQLLDSLEIEL